MKLALFAIGLFALGCGSLDPHDPELVETTSAALQEGNIILYESGVAVPESELSPLDPADLGGTVEGDVQWSGRVDLFENGLMGGVFQATRGRYSVLYVGALHATVHFGQVILTDELGSHLLNVGDSWLATKGTKVQFEVQGPRFQMSFLGNFNSEDAPGPVFLYQKGRGVPQSELSPFGVPDGLDVIALEGNPVFNGRIDYEQGPSFGGVFQSSRGSYWIKKSDLVEHNTFLRHEVLITEAATGKLFRVRPGDSLLFRAGTSYVVETNGLAFQDNFFAVTQP